MGKIKLSGYICERCGHKWVPRNEDKPIVCPRCKSPYWDKERKNEKTKKAKKSRKKEENIQIPTFVKWAGGKKRLVEQFKRFFPKKISTYHEPFVGGGAVGFYIIKKYKPKTIYFSDNNEELINCYTVIKNDVENLIKELDKHKKKHDKEAFYNIRSEDPSLLSPLSRAARFIYLNKTCFNGLYRVNSKGEFNVPIGRYTNPAISPKKDLKEISKLLKNVNLSHSDFSAVTRKAKKGDFIYFDPPYYPLNKTSYFTSYNKEQFMEKEQKKLAGVFKKLDKKGCKVMLSNSDTDFIKNLYEGYDINFVKAARMINCDATKRGAINEIVITTQGLASGKPKKLKGSSSKK